MDQLLTIRTYGPVDKHQRAGLIKIAGKEMLVEAILDLLTEKSAKDQTKVLEGLKSEIRDWQVIDAKIDNINKERVSLANRNKFKNLLENYTEEDLLIKVVEKDIDKITKEKTLNDYITLTSESKLNNSTKSELIEIYSNRLNQLAN